MRIISSFRDYYDSAQSQGQDASLIYKRESSGFGMKEGSFPKGYRTLVEGLQSRRARRVELRSIPARYGVSRINLEPGMVLFAGKLYPFVEVTAWHWDTLKGWETRCLYDLPELVAFLAQYEQELPSLKNRDASYIPFQGWRAPVRSYAEFFAFKGSTALQETAMAHRVVAAQTRFNDYLEVDGLLKSLEFYRVMNAWQAYQEISMYLGMLGQPAKPLVEISDKSKVAKHGFDQYSFRKPPQG